MQTIAIACQFTRSTLAAVQDGWWVKCEFVRAEGVQIVCLCRLGDFFSFMVFQYTIALKVQWH